MGSGEPPEKWRVLSVLLGAELCAMGTWFSASAVVPLLNAVWGLDESGRAWLTMSVQSGFVVGAFLSAVFNLADRVRAHVLFAVSALASAAATALIPFAVESLTPALVLRFFTGLTLAGVYPVGMKIVATWTRRDRGRGIGLLVGALTIGTAGPHFLNALGGMRDWRMVLYAAAAFAAAAGIIGGLFVREGPYRAPAPRFRWSYIGAVFRQRDLVLANLGYLGHMWELYAMWSWLPAFLAGSFAKAGRSSTAASFTAFAAVAAGGLGSVVAGYLADRFGRTLVTVVSMLASGTCALAAGALYGGSPAALGALAIFWGFTIVADSAQFSACVSELCDPNYLGTALTLQTCLGFLLTMFTIRLVPFVEGRAGEQWAFPALAIGPAFGIWAMLALRRRPEATKLAGGRR